MADVVYVLLFVVIVTLILRVVPPLGPVCRCFGFSSFFKFFLTS